MSTTRYNHLLSETKKDQKAKNRNFKENLTVHIIFLIPGKIDSVLSRNPKNKCEQGFCIEQIVQVLNYTKTFSSMQ